MMIVLRAPIGRIFLAVVISILIHAALFWFPNIQWPRDSLLLPPLTVNLSPLPKMVAVPAEKSEIVSRASKPDNATLDIAQKNIVDSMKEMEKSAKVDLLPEHLMLTFDLYNDKSIFRVGEVKHQLDILNGKYNLLVLKQGNGFSDLKEKKESRQFSQGTVGNYGFRPAFYYEENIIKADIQRLKVNFDWEKLKLNFLAEGEAVLPIDSQDAISYMYQFSQLSMNSEIIPFSIVDGVKVESIRVEIGSSEEITTPMGTLRALHLRKMHGLNEPYFEIWLAQEYRMFPVKFRQINSAGLMTEEFVITDIRAVEK